MKHKLEDIARLTGFSAATVSRALNGSSWVAEATRLKILEAARKVTGHPIPAEVVPRRPGDPPRLIADSTRARQELGWKPQFENAEAIIASVWKWLQKHPNGYSK